MTVPFEGRVVEGSCNGRGVIGGDALPEIGVQNDIWVSAPNHSSETCVLKGLDRLDVGIRVVPSLCCIGQC